MGTISFMFGISILLTLAQKNEFLDPKIVAAADKIALKALL